MGNKLKSQCIVCRKKIDKKQRYCSIECKNAFINNYNRLTRMVRKLYDRGISIETIAETFNIYNHEVKRLLKRATSVLNPDMRDIQLPDESKIIISFTKFEKLTAKKFVKPVKIYVDGEEFLD